MRIAIETSPLSGGHAGRGTGTYTRLLLQALKQFGTEIEIVEFHHEDQLPPVDGVHYPYFDPFLLTLPHSQVPTIVTVHDLIPIAAASHFPRGIRGEMKWQLQRRSLMQTNAIITDSEASKKDIASLIPYPAEKIQVVYLAPGPEFIPQSKAEQERVLTTYQLPERFLLYVGDVNWNKNIPGLIQAMEHIDVPLVLVGKAFLDENLAETQAINSLIRSQRFHAKIVKLGFVPAADLPAIYSAASVYVQPSFLEGFGLPVLEAMSCGTPAVVADTASLKEIAGPSIRVNPDDSADIATGITKALQLDKKSLRGKLVAWSQTFTWEKTAIETISVYKKILGGI